jgi:hypothetical protein
VFPPLIPEVTYEGLVVSLFADEIVVTYKYKYLSKGWPNLAFILLRILEDVNAATCSGGTVTKGLKETEQLEDSELILLPWLELLQ